MSINKKNIYLVGGAVRDMLMDIPISDKDYVAVGYSEDNFSNLPKVGKSFPVFLQPDGSELALARVERKTTHGYNGFEAKTQNVSLEDDLKRRDLTINSIAYDEINKKYIDPYNGIEDIKNKLLKHTSEAFCEDPMRVIRLARFRAKLGKEWRIDITTVALVQSMIEELKYLQPDRIYKEVVKVIEYENANLFFETLHELKVLPFIFPRIAQLTQNKNMFHNTMKLLKMLSQNKIELKYAALYYYVVFLQKDSIEKVLDIKLPNKTVQTIGTLIEKNLNTKNLQLQANDDIALLEWLKGFRKDYSLLNDVLYFNETLVELEKKTNCTVTQRFNRELILKIFKDICKYSPKSWLESLDTKPSNQKIASYIQDYNLQTVRKYKQLYLKRFIL